MDQKSHSDGVGPLAASTLLGGQSPVPWSSLLPWQWVSLSVGTGQGSYLQLLPSPLAGVSPSVVSPIGM